MMTTKTISGTYVGGYTLAANYTGVSVTTSGSVDSAPGAAGANGVSGHPDGGPGGGSGVALSMPRGGSLANDGQIHGGQGGGGGGGYTPPGKYSFGGAGGAGGVGGVGVSIVGVGSLTNRSQISGGGGGGGGYRGGPAQGGNGGDGGAGGIGIVLSASNPITNQGTILGGAGGAGGYGGGRDAPAYHSGQGGQGGDAIVLTTGGVVANTGLIEGGVGGHGGPGNGSGPFGGNGGNGGAGVALGKVGSVANLGTIVGGAGGLGGGYGGILGISGTQGHGIALYAGGIVTNGAATDTTARITGGNGVWMGAPGAVNNFGTIQGVPGPDPNVIYSYGIVTYGGIVTNGAANDKTALISGGVGVDLRGAGTVTNFGTITGAFGDSIDFTSSSDRLIAQAGATFFGQVAGGGGTLELAGGGLGTITGLGGSGTLSGGDSATFSGFGSYVIDAFGQWTVAGMNALANGQSLTVNGTLTVGGTLSDAPGATLALAVGGVVNSSGAAGAGIGGGAVTNASLIEGTGAGGLIIRSTSVDGSSGGVIEATNGSHIALQNATLLGGVLKSVGSGVIWTAVGSADGLNGTTAAVHNQATLFVANNSSLTLVGAIDNTALIGLGGQGGATRLIVATAGVTLSGGGRVMLDNNAGNSIVGASSAATLTNVDNVITGAGQIGAGSMMLINDAKGIIVGSLSTALLIDTGASTIANAGLIVAKGAGGVTIRSAIVNSGVLEAAGGVLTVNGAVSGSGAGVIASGTLDLASGFSQKVVFQGTTGVLELAQSPNYTGTVFGFSKTGGTSLDLRDIGFVSSTEATFKGFASGGVLTVTDGTHTAHITLRGDYRTSTFVAASDGLGGVIIKDPAKAAPFSAPAPIPVAQHQFIAAMAGLGGSSGAAIHTRDAWAVPGPMLFKPRAVVA